MIDSTSAPSDPIEFLNRGSWLFIDKQDSLSSPDKSLEAARAYERLKVHAKCSPYIRQRYDEIMGYSKPSLYIKVNVPTSVYLHSSRGNLLHSPCHSLPYFIPNKSISSS